MRKLLLLSLLLFSTPAWAAVAFVEFDFEDCDGASSCTEASHAAGGAGTITIVSQVSEDSTATDRDTAGCTMNGDAMTRVSDNEIITGNLEMDVYYKVAGTAGNIVCTWTGVVTGGNMDVVTYSGAHATQPDQVAEDLEAAATVIQTDILTVAENAMIVGFLGHTNGATGITQDVGQTQRGANGSGQSTLAVSEELATTATTYTLGETAVDSGGIVYKLFSIAPSTGRRRTAIVS